MENSKHMRVLAWPPGAPSDQNPYVNLMYSAFAQHNTTIIPFSPLMRRVPEADIFHIQWPESIFEGRGGNSFIVAAAKAWRIIRTVKEYRARKRAVVLTAHNLHPHAKMTPIKSILWQKFHTALLENVNLIIGLSQSSLDLFLAEHPRASGVSTAVIAHPHYRDAYPRANRENARKHFGLAGEKVIGVVGSIRPSKNVLSVVDIFRKAALESERLLITGACESAYAAKLKAAIEDDPRIIFYPHPLSTDQIAEAFAAIDVCLMNQTGTLNSGTALLALSLGRPLVAPDVGSLRELHCHFGEEWVKLFEPPLDLSQLRNILNNVPNDLSSIDDKLAAYSPIRLSAQLFTEFRKALDGI